MTDGGLDNLKGMSHLRTLCLSGARVTDAGLDRIKGLVNLRELYVSGTKVTPEGEARLHRACQNAGLPTVQAKSLSPRSPSDYLLDAAGGEKGIGRPSKGLKGDTQGTGRASIDEDRRFW